MEPRFWIRGQVVGVRGSDAKPSRAITLPRRLVLEQRSPAKTLKIKLLAFVALTLNLRALLPYFQKPNSGTAKPSKSLKNRFVGELLGFAALMPNLRAQFTFPEARLWNTEAQRADSSAKKKNAAILIRVRGFCVPSSGGSQGDSFRFYLR